MNERESVVISKQDKMSASLEGPDRMRWIMKQSSGKTMGRDLGERAATAP
jgi:hypothetical protein